MRNVAMACLFILVTAGPPVARFARADDDAGADQNDAVRAEEALKLTRNAAQAMQIYEGQEEPTRLQLVETPLQRYTNPIAGEKLTVRRTKS